MISRRNFELKIKQLLNDKYKIDRRAEKSRDHRDKKDGRESRHNRDIREDGRDNDNGHKHDFKKHDDHKRYRESKRDYKRDDNDFYRDDKRYNRYDERKSTHTPNSKDRFSTSKPRYDDKKQHYDERRGGGSGFDERRRDLNERRSYTNDDDRKIDRRNNDDRRNQRSHNEDRLNSYRPRRSSSPVSSQGNSNNKYSERKEYSSIRRERRRHSRSKSRSRSHSADNAIESNLPTNINSHQKMSAKELVTDMKHPEREPPGSEKKLLPTARNFEALLTLPLSENAPKCTVPVPSAVAAPNTATTTVQLPSYYNPNVINPNKYVEQMQKRKLIWGAKKTEDSASKWGHAQFSQDQDGKVASKFMRLMGIKNASGSSAEPSNSPNDSETKSPSSNTSPNNKDVKSREAMFSTMEQQYEVARQVTHTMRGVGLGFGSSRPY